MTNDFNSFYQEPPPVGGSSRCRHLSDAELLFSAKEALNAAGHIAETLSARQVLSPEFARPLLYEAVEAARVANCALVELQRRSVGVGRPKLGD